MCILKETSHLKSSYSASWVPITVEEFCKYIALLFYMSIVTDPNRNAYEVRHHKMGQMWRFLNIEIHTYSYSRF